MKQPRIYRLMSYYIRAKTQIRDSQKDGLHSDRPTEITAAGVLFLWIVSLEIPGKTIKQFRKIRIKRIDQQIKPKHPDRGFL